VDGWVLPKAPADVFMEGGNFPVPLLIGSNAQETGGPEEAAGLREKIRKTYGALAERALPMYGLAGDGQGQTDPCTGRRGGSGRPMWNSAVPRLRKRYGTLRRESDI